MAFTEFFKDPVRDIYADTGWAVSREDYSKETAAMLFADAADEDNEETSVAEFLKTMKIGFAVFGFGSNDDDEVRNGWWWQHGEATKPRQKKVWLAY